MDYKLQIACILHDYLSQDEALALLTPPKDVAMGDLCLPCFKLAKTLRKSPVAIAQEIAQTIEKPDFVSEITAVAGYVNFRYDSHGFAKQVVGEVLQKGADYGKSNVGGGQTVCIDYSSINIAKPFHIGHLSTTVLGAALYRLYNELGYRAVGINHLGDWGTQFGKLIVAYHKWSTKQEIEQGGVRKLVEIYVKFHQEAELHPELEDEARQWFRRLEEGDEEAVQLWSWFKQITLQEDLPLYERLGVHFDSYAGESFYNDKMQRVIDELQAKGLLTDSEGAKIVDLGPSMTPCIIVKSDGATLYATRDLAAALYRYDTYHFAKCLYVVAYQQNLHFKQWFAVIDKMGYDWADKLEHVAFGMVSLADGAMSTRKGNAVWLTDVIDQAVQKAKEIIAVKSPDLANPDQVAEMVGVGSVIFSALINGRIKDIEFRYDKILNFDGETCPYVQYTHARCASVLAKAGTDWQATDYSSLDDDICKDIVRSLERYPSLLLEAADKNEPSMITRHIVDLAKLYNKFYFDNKILSAPDGVRQARLALTQACKIVMENGMRIIGIQLPDKM